MATEIFKPGQDFRIEMTFDIQGVDNDQLADVTIKEIVMAESLLTPGLQTSVTMQSYIYNIPVKNMDLFKNKVINIKLKAAIGEPEMEVEQTIYRMDSRRFIGTNVSKTEEYVLHLCDQSLLNDAKSLVSKSWKCTKPSDIVKYVLTSCAGVKNLDVEKANPAYDYIAENIHPFRVVAQQANAALSEKGNDPSFVHFMTYANKGTHVFKSLKTMSEGSVKKKFKYSESGVDSGISQSEAAISFSFPTDFDLLSDILNGINEQGQDKNTGVFANPVSKSISQFGNKDGGCGVGGFNYKSAVTNKGTAQDQNSCETNIESYMLKRQARMGLIERDKIALRLLVPWNPDLHAGDVIALEWNHPYPDNDKPVYGSGEYLIVNLMHRIGHGGVGVTAIDAVSKTVGGGIV